MQPIILFLKKNKITTIGVLILFLAVGSIIIGRQVTNRSRQNRDRQLIVGMMSGWPPFMSINAAGEFEGFDVDVAQALAQKMGKQITIKDLGSLESLFLALEQGKIDMIFSGLDITKQRLATMNMVQYTGAGFTTMTLLFWEKIPAGIKELQDLIRYPDKFLCVEPGSASQRFVDQFPAIKQKPISRVIDMILEIQYGKSLAAILEPTVATRLARINPDIKLVEIPVPEEFRMFGCGIALQKKNTQLTAQVAQKIDELKKEGTIKTLEQKWQLENVA